MVFIRISPESWKFCNIEPQRKAMLNAAPEAGALVDSIYDAAKANHVTGLWEEYRQQRGLFRFEAEFPISKDLFDCVFHGPSGYRAQYYHDEATGEAYNRLIIDRLLPVMQETGIADPILIERSLRGHGKVTWYKNGNDGLIYRDSVVILNTPEWDRFWNREQNAEKMGLKDFMLENPRIFVKGAFIDPDDPDVVHDNKPGRAEELHKSGWT